MPILGCASCLREQPTTKGQPFSFDLIDRPRNQRLPRSMTLLSRVFQSSPGQNERPYSRLYVVACCPSELPARRPEAASFCPYSQFPPSHTWLRYLAGPPEVQYKFEIPMNVHRPMRSNYLPPEERSRPEAYLPTRLLGMGFPVN